MKHLIIGSNSNLAKEYIKKLERPDYLGISRQRQPNGRSDNNEDIYFELGKVQSGTNIQRLCQQVRAYMNQEDYYVIIFTWSGTPRTSKDNAHTYNQNINIINNSIYIIEELNPKGVVMISSSGGLYASNAEKEWGENDAIEPKSEYGKQKAKFEIELQQMKRNHEIKLCILRVTTAYGYVKNITGQGVINQWCHEATTSSQVKIFNTANSLINFISFEQVAEAITLSIRNQLDGTYNIGSEQSTKMSTLVREIKKIANGEKSLQIRQERNDERYMRINTKKFSEATGKIFKTNVIAEMKIIYDQVLAEKNAVEMQSARREIRDE